MTQDPTLDLRAAASRRNRDSVLGNTYPPFSGMEQRGTATFGLDRSSVGGDTTIGLEVSVMCRLEFYFGLQWARVYECI